MNWPFGRARSTKKEKGIPLREREIPPDEERSGPAPPPPRTAHAPGVSVYKFDAIPFQHLLRLEGGHGGFFLDGEEGIHRSAALLVLMGKDAALGSLGTALSPSPGDVLIWTAAAPEARSPPGASSPSLSFEEISRTSPTPHHHIRRDDLGGRGVPGISGLRTLVQLPEERLAVLRLGPPPGARWVFRGIHAVAVFSGRFAAVDGDEVKEIRAGSFARVADPSATLYLEAGNDSALGVALAESGFLAALG